ncbi:hypothetical protein Trydic_g3578 [Trypoxylus dichotomus]
MHSIHWEVELRRVILVRLSTTRGSSSVDKDPRHLVRIAHMVVKNTTKQWKDKRSRDWWKSIPGQRQAWKFLVRYGPTFTVNLLSRDRKSVRTIVDLLTGHCILRTHMSNLGPAEEISKSQNLCGGITYKAVRSRGESKANVFYLLKE